MMLLKSITVTRLEGALELCDNKPHVFTSWAEANAWLRKYDDTYPRSGGYDKHRFIVEWEDGVTYEDRLDCQHSTCKYPDQDIKEHVVSKLEWMAGQKQNPWCGMEQYRKEMQSMPLQVQEESRDFLNKYFPEDERKGDA